MPSTGSASVLDTEHLAGTWPRCQCTTGGHLIPLTRSVLSKRTIRKCYSKRAESTDINNIAYDRYFQDRLENPSRVRSVPRPHLRLFNDFCVRLMLNVVQRFHTFGVRWAPPNISSDIYIPYQPRL